MLFQPMTVEDAHYHRSDHLERLISHENMVITDIVACSMGIDLATGVQDDCYKVLGSPLLIPFFDKCEFDEWKQPSKPKVKVSPLEVHIGKENVVKLDKDVRPSWMELNAEYYPPQDIPEPQFVATYIDASILDDAHFILTEKGAETAKDVPVNLNWLNNEIPKHERPLSRQQRKVLLDMCEREQRLGQYNKSPEPVPTIAQGKDQQDFFERLETRGLVYCTECQTRKHGLHVSYWKLTSKGQHTVYNFAEYVPF